MKKIAVAACVLAASSSVALSGINTASADDGSVLALTTETVTGRFVAGSGLYLRGVNRTDGIRKINGWARFTQHGAGSTMTVTGTITGLLPGVRYVAVAYRDGICAPIVGVTAYPSGSFVANASGVARPVGVTVNPRAINPVGTINVPQVHSISIRRVVLTPVPLPALPGYPLGVPAGTPIAPAQTPTVPNAAIVQGCDRTVMVVS